METKLEVAMIKANTPLLGGLELYWLLSRSQLEFILQDIKVLQSPPLAAAAQYQEAMLPVINLEEHFGLPESTPDRSIKYLVVRAVIDAKSLVKVIIRTPKAMKMLKLESPGFAEARQVSLPRNRDHLLGVFSLPDGSLALVPDVAGISRSIKWQGNQHL